MLGVWIFISFSVATFVDCYRLYSAPIRQTQNGAVAGVLQKGFSRGYVEAFYGIPFAKPPVGDLRFEDPLEPLDWEGIRQATELPPVCYQIDDDMAYIQQHRRGLQNQSEDCLYLNVFIPANRKASKRMAVMLFIHGGSNVVGTGLMFDGNYLASHGQIVVVTTNYRLAALGFLGTGNPDFRGNYAMLDQIMAMKWIKNNIANFKGDPEKVTVLGHSSGGMDVGLHFVSPLSKGLFRAVGSQSGPPTTRLAWKPPRADPEEEVRNVSRTLGCTNATLRDMKQCLKGIPAETLMKGQRTYPIYDTFEFPVLIDGRFLPEEPEKLLKKKQFNANNYLIGYTTSEADYFATAYYIPQMIQLLQEYHVLQNKVNVTDTIYYEYTNWKKRFDDGSMRHSSSNVMSDAIFKVETINTADLAVKGGVEVYMYQWDRAPASDDNRFVEPWFVVPHGIDLFYLFGSAIAGHSSFTFNKLDRKMSYFMMESWSNYVKHLILAPSSELNQKRSYNTNQTFLRFGAGKKKPIMSVRHDPLPRHVYFWKTYLPELTSRLEKTTS